MRQGYWAHFSHGADIGIRGVGTSKEKAFEQAGVALTAVVTDPERVSPSQTVAITCSAPDDAILLADFLNRLIFEMATRNMLFGKYEVHLQENLLHATARGEQVDIARHEPAVEIKGATYTDLRVERDRDGMWIAQCVVDV
jgi:tRNA nucleotidyltransferase (CCA-adding enzyme)